MAFGDDMNRFREKVNRRARLLHNGTADQVFVSVVEGSSLTGAPGQPVDTGYLRGSWQNVIEAPLVRLIVTRCAYAPVIETGVRAAYDPQGTVGEEKEERKRHKSTVGGQHSVALTRTGFDRITAYVTRLLTAGEG